MPGQEWADAQVVVTHWLRTHLAVLAALGDETHVTGQVEEPYPHLAILPSPGGSDRDLYWMKDEALSIELWGGPERVVAPSALKRILYVVLGALRDLADTSIDEPRMPVVTSVRSVGGVAPLPSDGQDRVVARVLVSIHPPTVTPDQVPPPDVDQDEDPP